MGSPQTLSEPERRMVAAWAADCAARVLGLFEAEAPADGRPRDAIARARAFARGELGVAGEIRRRFIGGAAARDGTAPAAVAAARAAGQAASIPHMGAHALGAAAYAAKAAGLAAPDRPEAVGEELRWQLDSMSAAVRAALRQLPPVGGDPSGPLGPGLLASGLLGTIIRDLQAGLAGGREATRRSRRPDGLPVYSGPVSAEEVDDYLRAVEEPKRTTLETLRRTIVEIVPDAEQVISYRVPAFRLGGKTIAGFAAFRNHLSYLPFSGSVLPRLADDLDGYTMTKSALHFPVDRSLSKTLVQKLIAARLSELPRSGDELGGDQLSHGRYSPQFARRP